MKKLYLLLSSIWNIGILLAAPPEKERAAIRSLCGCFSVTFNYAETFTNDTLTVKKAHPMDKRSVLEWITPIEQGADKWVLQHILLVPDGTTIKHWREDWVYEQAALWRYDGDKKWHKTPLSASELRGKWMQTVWEVDDAPRYQGAARWLAADGQYFWLNTADAPLPRREYTKRHDYNVLKRTNKIIITPEGWTHEQDNKKIIRKAAHADSLLAEEKGYNIYTRVPDTACMQAQVFWTKEKDVFWKEVRAVWQEEMRQGATLQLQTKVAGKFLSEHLQVLEEQKMSAVARRTAIQKTLRLYIVSKS